MKFRGLMKRHYLLVFLVIIMSISIWYNKVSWIYKHSENPSMIVADNIKFGNHRSNRLCFSYTNHKQYKRIFFTDRTGSQIIDVYASNEFDFRYILIRRSDGSSRLVDLLHKDFDIEMKDRLSITGIAGYDDDVKSLYLSSQNALIRINVITKDIKKLPYPGFQFYRVALGNNGRSMAVMDQGKCLVLSIGNGVVTGKYNILNCSNPILSNKGDRIAYLGANGKLHIATIKGNNIIDDLPIETDESGDFRKIQWSHDDKHLAFESPQTMPVIGLESSSVIYFVDTDSHIVKKYPLRANTYAWSFCE